MTRSLKKGPFIDEKLFAKIEAMNNTGEKRVSKTWARRSTISPEFVGHTLAVHNGNKFIPIFITENGVDDSQDVLRPRYILEHLHALWKVMNENSMVEGYFHWSLVDNFEWERGWTQRFGLWGLDVATQARIRRPSVDLYAEICRTNGISADMVEKYAPESMKTLFP